MLFFDLAALANPPSLIAADATPRGHKRSRSPETYGGAPPNAGEGDDNNGTFCCSPTFPVPSSRERCALQDPLLRSKLVPTMSLPRIGQIELKWNLLTAPLVVDR